MTAPRYPVYVISKGRAKTPLTARALAADGVPFSLVVEPQEVEVYRAELPDARILALPFSNLGLGSIPARNWVWEHALSVGAARHWVLDDNMRGFWRRWKARKIRCHAGAALSAMEDFADAHENVGVAGPNYYMFAVNKLRSPPFTVNTHVYSCLLIRNDLPCRWRGRYNEDVDLCLQVLAGGLCTVQFNAFLVWKMTTMTMKGGNTDELYRGDGRLEMARSLQRAWPGIVTVSRRFQRPQHVVDWTKFRTALVRRPGVAATAPAMVLRQYAEPKSAAVRELVAGHAVRAER